MVEACAPQHLHREEWARHARGSYDIRLSQTVENWAFTLASRPMAGQL